MSAFRTLLVMLLAAVSFRPAGADDGRLRDTIDREIKVRARRITLPGDGTRLAR